MKEWLEEMTDKKEEEFRVQFKDSIQIMAGALKAGYSAENAIRETCHTDLHRFIEIIPGADVLSDTHF